MVDTSLLTVISCCLSIVGAVLIMCSFWLFPAMQRKRGRELLMYLSIADLLSAASYMWAGLARFHSESVQCRVQAITSIYFPVASFLWTDCIAVFIYSFFKGHKHTNFVAYHVISWGLPVVVVVLVATFNMEGYYAEGGTTGGWCWIKNDHRGDAWEWMWMLIGGKGVEWLSIVVTAMFYFAVYQAYKSRLRMLRSGAISSVPSNDQRDGMASGVPPRRQQSQGASAATEFTVKLVAVPIVFFGARLFGNINVVRTLATGNTDGQDWLDVLQAIFDPSQGACNAVMFVLFSKEVRTLYANLFVDGFLRCSGRCCPRRCHSCLHRACAWRSGGGKSVDPLARVGQANRVYGGSFVSGATPATADGDDYDEHTAAIALLAGASDTDASWTSYAHRSYNTVPVP